MFRTAIAPRRPLKYRRVLRLFCLERRDVPTSLSPLYKIHNASGGNTPAGSPAPVGLIPSQIRHAYGIDSVMFGAITGDGTGQTIAIIDAFDNPSFVSSTDPGYNSSDLHKFCVQFGIPDPPSFKKMDQTGGTAYPSGDKGWGTEIALDVEWAHAIAPGASIILVEAVNSSSANLYPAAAFAASLPGVVAVSMSFGHKEVASDPGQNGFFVTPGGHAGVTFLAATGDGGAPGSGYPAYAPTVVAVGGTTLTLGPGNTYGSETGWAGSGGGLSVYQSNPSFQTAASPRFSPIPAGGGAGGKRTIPDVSFDADPASGVAVLDSFSQGAAAPWIQVGGTSFSSPAWAALIAITDQGRGIAGLGSLDGPSETLPKLYSFAAADYHDITAGNNGFAAGVGYDQVTGIGTPVIPALINDLIGTSTVVTNINDSGVGSLRQAVLNANALAGVQIVTFDPIVFGSLKTITLTTGVIPISDAVTIQGPGSGLVRVSGNNVSQIFSIDVPTTSANAIAINGMDIRNGKVTGNGAAIFDADESLTMTDVIVETSTATSAGGGVFLSLSAASLNMTNCIVRNNTATGNDGGGIDVEGNSTVILNSCTVSGNVAGDDGGGVYFFSGGTLTMTNTTISGNITNGDDGGGMYLFATKTTINNSTISGNSAKDAGGGIVCFSGSTVLIQNTTIAFNTSTGLGGGIDNDANGSTINTESTIIGKNVHAGSPDVSGNITENFGLISDITGAVIVGANNVNSVDPLLGGLAFNGGFTATHSISLSSPALNKGSNPIAASFDQRGVGYPRVQQGQADIGAYELIPTSFIVTNTNDSGTGSLRKAVDDSDASAGTQSVTFDPVVFATAKTITLTSGEIGVDDSVNVVGPTVPVTVSGNSASRIFDVGSGSSLTVNVTNVNFTKGSKDIGGAVFAGNDQLTFNNCDFTFNSASTSGGAIYVFGTGGSVTVNDGALIGNTCVAFGGAIDVFGTGAKTILRRSTISGNVAGTAGGFYAGQYLLMDGCTVAQNVTTGAAYGGVGGAIFLGEPFGVSTIIMRNSTVTGNSSKGKGGAVYGSFGSGSTITVQNCTIFGNTGSTGGGFAVVGQTLSLESSVISGNTGGAAPDISSAGTVGAKTCAIGSNAGFVLTDNGGNLAFGTALKLGPLANNGGPTQTMMPAFDSPLVNKGSNPAFQSFDQRSTGYPRALNAIADIGAIEFTPTGDLVVRNINDAGADSLRQCVIDSNGMVGIQNISFDPTVFATAKTITLTTGEIPISDTTTITGPAAQCTVSGNSLSRVFNANVGGNPSVTLIGLKLTGGKGAAQGGAILSSGNLTLQSCTITGNSASFGGGVGVFSGGLLTINDSFITNNVATSNSGGFFAGSAIIRRTTVSGNSAVTGAGFYSLGSLSLIDSTVSGNKASASSGGMELESYSSTDVMLIQNSTISGNSAATSGGGVGLGGFGYFAGTLRVQNSTITNNTANGGSGGGGIARIGGTGLITLDSTIVSGNLAAGANKDLFTTGTVNANFSAVGTKTGVTIFAGDAKTNALLGAALSLGALADNGGPTLSHLPAVGSVLINNGSNVAVLATDQRGSVRVIGGQADIGAVETSPQFLVTNANDHGQGSLRQCTIDANITAGLQTITFEPVFFSVPRTIVLTTGEMSIAETVNIAGPGNAFANVSGNDLSRIFNTSAAPASAVIRITDLTMSKGVGATGGAIAVADEALTLTNCVLTGNSGSSGGAIDVSTGTGSLTLQNCTVSNNSSTQGGGLRMVVGGSLLIQSCTFSGNVVTVGNSGGAIRFGGTIGAGGFTILNSTFVGNSSGFNGGAIGFTSLVGTAVFQNCTITGNNASGGGGGIGANSAVNVSLESCIVSGNTATNPGPDLLDSGTITAKFSLIGSSAGVTTFTPDATTTALLGKAPLLGPLVDNGGPTQTVLPLVGSPAIDAGSNPAALATDQHGGPRQVGAGVDIGAMEFSPQFVVTNDLDHGSGSLRQCVLDANATPGFQNITFDPVFFAVARTINLTTGEVDIGETETITGPNNGTAVNNTIAGNRVFSTFLGGTGEAITISGLTISGGNTTGSGGGIFVGDEALTLINCTLTGNTAARGGGAYLYLPTGSLTFKGCTISNNTSTNSGSGINLWNGGSLTLDSSTVSGNNNTGGGGGGGIYFWGPVGAGGLVVRNSTIANNTSASSGGGIFINNFSGTFTIQNSTIVGNSATAGNGGGIADVSAGTVSIESSIVSGNINAAAPDIFSGSTVNVKTSAIGNNLGFVETDQGGNLAFQPFANLKLGPLANNGGPTQTFALLTGSPCLNTGSNPAPAAANDQRGFLRQAGPAVDMGAFERQLPPTAVVQVNDGSVQRSIVTRLVVTFSGPPVAFPSGVAAAFQLNRTGPGAPIGTVNLGFAQVGNVVTITFLAGGVVGIDPGGSLQDGAYQLTIFAAKVTGDLGQQLDGNNDGTGGDNFQTPFAGPGRIHRLFGDSDGNALVDGIDFGNFRTAFNTNNFTFDYDGSTIVDGLDFGQFRARFGSSV